MKLAASGNRQLGSAGLCATIPSNMMGSRKPFRIKLRSRTLILGERTLVMGVLNVTPDSFSDGGNFFSQEKAVRHALQMERDGADLIDIGAESTRPGSLGVGAEEDELRGAAAERLRDDPLEITARMEMAIGFRREVRSAE